MDTSDLVLVLLFLGIAAWIVWTHIRARRPDVSAEASGGTVPPLLPDQQSESGMPLPPRLRTRAGRME
jgi:hypothetical protein